MSDLVGGQQKEVLEAKKMTTLANISFCGGRVDAIEICVNNGFVKELCVCEDICLAWREKLVVCCIQGGCIIFATDKESFLFLIDNSNNIELEKVKEMLERGYFYLQSLRKGFRLVRGN